MDRAKTQAGDLAHALKTPLAILGAVARQAANDDRKDLAEPIDEQITQMRRQIDRVLARARAGIAAALGRKTVSVAPVADKVVRAFERLPDTRTLQWECDIEPGAVFPGEEGDLTEMLGNLLDNARKWARYQNPAHGRRHGGRSDVAHRGRRAGAIAGPGAANHPRPTVGRDAAGHRIWSRHHARSG